MTKLEFNSNATPTLGVELELALVDGNSMALSSSIESILGEIPSQFVDCFKPELMQCCVEVNTGICQTVAEVEADLTEKLGLLQTLVDKNNLQLWWGATHPFSLWKEQTVTPNQRYEDLLNSLEEMARRLVTFGLHIHVGVDSGDKAVMICDRIMQHLPSLLALTCSSAFWENRNTGLHSHRSKVMEGLPTAGLPSLMRNWSEYVWLVNHLVETGFLNTIREIWWDVRPHHNFGTVEVRVCDMPGSLSDVLAVTGLVQSLVQKLSDQIDQGTYQLDCHPMMVRQNKWRACRFGTDAQLVNSYSYKVQSVTEVAEFLRDQLLPTADSLQCVDYLEKVVDIAKAPSWAERQRAIWKETGDKREIVRQLVKGSRLD